MDNQSKAAALLSSMASMAKDLSALELIRDEDLRAIFDGINNVAEISALYRRMWLPIIEGVVKVTDYEVHWQIDADGKETSTWTGVTVKEQEREKRQEESEGEQEKGIDDQRQGAEKRYPQV